MIRAFKRYVLTFISWFVEHVLENASASWVKKVNTGDEVQKALDTVEPLDVVLVRSEGWLSTNLKAIFKGSGHTHCAKVYRCFENGKRFIVESGSTGVDYSNLLNILTKQSKVEIRRPRLTGIQKSQLLSAIQATLDEDRANPVKYNYSLVYVEDSFGNQKVVSTPKALTCSQYLRKIYEMALGTNWVDKNLPKEEIMGFYTIKPEAFQNDEIFELILKIE